MKRSLLNLVMLCMLLFISIITPVHGQISTNTYTVDASTNPATATQPDGSSAFIATDETVTLRIQAVLQESVSISLTINAAFGSNFNYVNNSARVSYLANTPPSLNGDFAGIQNQAEPTLTFPASRVNVSGSSVSFDFGSTINNDGDGDSENLIIEYDLVPAAGAVIGTTVNLSYNLVIDGGFPTELILTSNEISLEIVDPPGVTITPSGGSTDVTEGGATDTFTVVLMSQPSSDVTITRVANPQLSISPTELIFNNANWNTPQVFTVTAINDSMVEGAHSSSISFTVSSADANYNAFVVSPVFVNITDNDSAGITVTQSGGSTDVTEGGATDTFNIALTSEPVSDVTIMFTGTEITTNPTQVILTAGNWNIAQEVTVTAVNDDVAEGAHTGSVGFSLNSSDSVYEGLAAPALNVNISDNDNAGIVVSSDSGLTTTEAGGTAQFTIELTSQPAANVTIDLMSSDSSEGTVSPAQVIFTSADWNVAQTVTVMGVDDAIEDGNVAYTVDLTVTSGDANFNGITDGVSVSNQDDDAAGVSVTPNSLIMTELSPPEIYSIRLTSTPSQPVTLAVTFDSAQITVNGSSSSPLLIVFNTSDIVALEVDAVENPNDNTPRQTVIAHSIVSSTAPEYPVGMLIDSVTVSIDDFPPPPPVPLCEDHNFDEGGVVRSSTSDPLGYAINCRVLYQNGAPTTWLGSNLYSEANLGIPGLVNLGVQQAIDIFSPGGLTYFEGGAVFCLRGSGTLIWLAASGIPRHAEIIGSYTVPEFPGFTCATLFEPGTLVLVLDDPMAE